MKVGAAVKEYVRRRKGWRQRSKAVRRTAEEKANLLNSMNNEVRQGSTVIDVSEKYRVSTASFYRWARQRDKIQTEYIAASYSQLIRIDEAISVLSFSRDHHDVEVLEFLFAFMTSLRWPKKTENHLVSMICCISSYINQKSETKSIAAADVSLQKLLFKYLKTDVLHKMCSPDAPFFPDYDALSNVSEVSNDLDFYARVTEYLISEVESYPIDEYRPTLSRAGKLVEQGVFGKKWVMSERTFDENFKLRAASFPFLFIDAYHGGPGLSLNPNLPGFAEQCDALVEQRDDLHTYFARCAWATRILEALLQRRTLLRASFPTFPPSLKVDHLPRPRLSADLRAKIRAL